MFQGSALFVPDVRQDAAMALLDHVRMSAPYDDGSAPERNASALLHTAIAAVARSHR